MMGKMMEKTKETMATAPATADVALNKSKISKIHQITFSTQIKNEKIVVLSYKFNVPHSHSKRVIFKQA